MSRETLQNIIGSFDLQRLKRFFSEKNSKFHPSEEAFDYYNTDKFSSGLKLGELSLDNGTLLVCAFEAKQELSERSGKKAQYELGKKILKETLTDAGIFIYYNQSGSFRFSLIYANYLDNRRDWSTFRRFTYFVSRGFTNKTFLQRIGDGDFSSLEKIKDAFSVDKVTKEFYLEYRKLFDDLVGDLSKNHTFINEAAKNNINTENFAKKLLGQIVFIYFLQKKGWLGVPVGEKWGKGNQNFLSSLFTEAIDSNKNYYNDYLEKLFYDALNNSRRESVDPSFSKIFNCRIPFLNGGLFDPEYEWEKSFMYLDNKIFGRILETFDRYNFTVEEESPEDKEVAIDPEMLGKVFENLLPENLKKGTGTFYTPREIVHYMCQESLINYLSSSLPQLEEQIRDLIHFGEFSITESPRMIILTPDHSQQLDDLLMNIRIVDPACGSGAFLVGMLHEVVKARLYLSYFNQENTTEYPLKKETIQNCIYGVDIDPGAIEIAKLRLWLSLVVDYDLEEIEPLPNLDYKLMVGNSLIEKFDSQVSAITNDSDRNKLIYELRELKDAIFNLSSSQEKKELRMQINELILQIENYDNEKKRQNIFEKILGRNNQVKLFELGNEQQSLADMPTQIKQLYTLKDVKEIDHFEWHLNFNEVFEKGGFNIVIANPPYIGEKGHKEMFREIRKGSLINFYQRKMDLFYFFFHLAINLGKQDSNIAFITTNYYPTATGGKKLREDFKNRTIISHLVNLNELKIFESALGQHNMITILQKRNSENAIAKTCITKRQGDSKPETLQAIMDWKDEETDYFQVAQNDIFDGDEYYIRLAGSSGISDNPTQAILEKVKSVANPLKIFCHVNMGVQSGADAIGKKLLKRALDQNYTNKNYLLKNQLKIGDKIYIIDGLLFNKLPLRERGIVKPFIKNSEIKDYFIPQTHTQYYIYADSKVDINEYPTIKQHLLKFRPILKAREQVGDGEDSWYWIRGSKREFLVNTGSHIVCPYRSKKNLFALTDGNIIGAGDIYYITRKDLSISLNYILALLNSKLYYLWLYHRGKRKGETLELYQQPLSEIPIKKISPDEQKPFIETVDKILAITKSGDYLENPTKKEEVKDYEKQIDQLVYKLYDLKPQEIEIVKGRN